MKDENKFAKIYYNEVGRENVLDSDTERKLSQRILNGDENAATQLATSNLRFVMHMAKKYQGKGIDTEDLVSEGNIALVEAARRYDASHGCRFVAYAAPFIDKAMRNIIASESGIVSTPKNASSVDKKRSHAKSVDAPIGGMENLNLLSILVNENSPSPEHNINNSENAEKIRHIMTLLNERQRKVISYIYGIGVQPITMAEIGVRMGLKRERVRQIRNRVLRKLAKKN